MAYTQVFTVVSKKNQSFLESKPNGLTLNPKQEATGSFATPPNGILIYWKSNSEE